MSRSPGRPAPVRLTRVARQALAESLGSAGLVTVVIGSGIAAQRLSPYYRMIETV